MLLRFEEDSRLTLRVSSVSRAPVNGLRGENSQTLRRIDSQCEVDMLHGTLSPHRPHFADLAGAFGRVTFALRQEWVVLELHLARVESLA